MHKFLKVHFCKNTAGKKKKEGKAMRQKQKRMKNSKRMEIVCETEEHKINKEFVEVKKKLSQRSSKRKRRKIPKEKKTLKTN